MPRAPSSPSAANATSQPIWREQRHQRLAVVLVVLDHEDPRPPAGGRRSAAARVGLARARVGRERQADHELAAAAQALAPRHDLAAVQLDQGAHEGEADPEAALRAHQRAVGLLEEIEDDGSSSGSMPTPVSRREHGVACPSAR